MNLDFIKNKLDALQGKNKQSSKFWKPSEGEQKVRILPYKFNRENPFTELKFYYYRQANGTTKTFLSPSVNGNPDPVLEFCEKLRGTGSKENWVLSKSYEPKLRTYVPVIVRGQEDQGVKFWGFGKTVYEAILEKMSNPDIGDITDLENGNDLIIKFTKLPPTGKKYPDTKIDVRFKKTPAVDPSNNDLMAKIQDQVDVMTLFTEPNYAELKQEFENHINPDNDQAPEIESEVPTDQGGNVEVDETSAPAKTLSPTEPSENDTGAVVSPSAEKAASVALSPEDMKAKFKQMFANAATAKV
jgi:hypothetical protein